MPRGTILCALGLLALILAGASLRFSEEVRTLTRDLEAAGVELARVRMESAERIDALERLLRERDEALRRAEADAGILRVRIAELSARIAELQAALADREAAPIDPRVPAVLPPDELEMIEIAAVEAAEIAAASDVPFVDFEDLPPEYQEELEAERGRALFVRYPPNRWGENGIIVVQVGAMEGGEWSWLPLDPYSQPLFRRIAELSYLEKVAEEERIEDLIRRGDGTWYPDRSSAEANLGSLLVQHENGQTGGWLREDPGSGRTWICPGTLVLDSKRLQRIGEQRSLVGSMLINGRTGSIRYGVVRR